MMQKTDLFMSHTATLHSPTTDNATSHKYKIVVIVQIDTRGREPQAA